jgi:hypothetical protein
MVFHSHYTLMVYFLINKGSINYYSLVYGQIKARTAIVIITVCFNVTTLVNVYTAVLIVLVYN